jgi:hypothetical protein
VEGTSQAILGSSDQRNVPASVSLDLKSEKGSILKKHKKKSPVPVLVLVLKSDPVPVRFLDQNWQFTAN